jgi:hypothetical protein
MLYILPKKMKTIRRTCLSTRRSSSTTNYHFPGPQRLAARSPDLNPPEFLLQKIIKLLIVTYLHTTRLSLGEITKIIISTYSPLNYLSNDVSHVIRSYLKKSKGWLWGWKLEQMRPPLLLICHVLAFSKIVQKLLKLTGFRWDTCRYLYYITFEGISELLLSLLSDITHIPLICRLSRLKSLGILLLENNSAPSDPLWDTPRIPVFPCSRVKTFEISFHPCVLVPILL